MSDEVRGMWIRRIDGNGPWMFAGEVLEPCEAIEGGVIWTENRPAKPVLNLPVGLTLRLEPCPLCRATLVIINDKLKGPASFRLDDGDVVITPHADTCYGERGRTPGTWSAT